jgi:hypothetical protein
MSYTQRFEDPRCFEAWKRTKKHQGPRWMNSKPKVKVTKNQTNQFWIPEYPIFTQQIESKYGLRFNLFRNDLVISDSKSYILLPI